MSSDSDVNAGFEMDSGKNVDITGGTIPGGLNSTKNIAPSKDYCFNSQFRLPFGGPSRPLQLQYKLDKKVAKRLIKRQTSVRRASTIPTTMASAVKAMAQAFDSSSEVCLFTSDDPDKAYAASGATGVMLSGFHAFILYRKYTNRFAILGNETPLPILGGRHSNIQPEWQSLDHM